MPTVPSPHIAVPFSRVWCCVSASLSRSQPSLLFPIGHLFFHSTGPSGLCFHLLTHSVRVIVVRVLSLLSKFNFYLWFCFFFHVDIFVFYSCGGRSSALICSVKERVFVYGWLVPQPAGSSYGCFPFCKRSLFFITGPLRCTVWRYALRCPFDAHFFYKHSS